MTQPRLIYRLWGYARRTSPYLVIRFLAITLLFSPIGVWLFLVSVVRGRRWRGLERSRAFIRRNQLAFENFDIDTLAVKPLGGGISNLSLMWSGKMFSGEEVAYYVKIFMPVGTFWAFSSPFVVPLPHIYGFKMNHRFIADMVGRAQLAEVGVPVPKLYVYDPVENVMVSDFLKGQMVGDVIMTVKERQDICEIERRIMKQCGEALGRVHAAGFSLIDIQPANCMWVPEEEKVYFIDMEFCTRQDYRTWDLGYFFCYITIAFPHEFGVIFKTVFLDGYQQFYQPDWQGVKKLNVLLKEYMPIFQSIVDIRAYTPDELFRELLTFEALARGKKK